MSIEEAVRQNVPQLGAMGPTVIEKSESPKKWGNSLRMGVA